MREEDFERVLSAGALLIIVGTLAYSIGGGWSVIDGLYVAAATLTTSSILDPDLTITSPWLKLFTAGYVLVGIGILVEIARRLGLSFITARGARAGQDNRARHDDGRPKSRHAGSILVGLSV